MATTTTARKRAPVKKTGPGKKAPAKKAPAVITREQWLDKLVKTLRPRYGGELPEKIHISIGFPSKGIRSKSIGECWHPDASADAAPQVFVHPRMSDPVEVAAVVMHELVHACRPEAKHGPEFKKLALSLGLTGKMTATVPSADLVRELDKLVEDKLGPYPHPALSGGRSSAKPKQSTRMIKCVCEHCDYLVRTTSKWLDVGAPRCPDGIEMTPVE